MADGKKNIDDVVLLALAAGLSAPAAARRAQCSERTVRRRLADAAFRQRVQELRGQLVDRAAGVLARGMTAAARRLRQLVRSAASETAQLAAAKAVLELATTIRKVTEFEERLASIESRVPAGDVQP